MVILDNLEIIKELTLPMMMNKNQLCTINNWATMHWAVKSKIKNQYKELLKSWFLDHKEKLPDDIIFYWEPIYKDKRRRDSINMASMAKVIEDCFVEIGIIKDDNQTTHILTVGRSEKSTQHKIKLKIYSNSEN